MYSLRRNNLNDCEFLTGNRRSRRKWRDIFKVFRETNCQPRVLYAVKIPFRKDGEVKALSGQGAWESVAGRPALQGLPRDALQTEGNAPGDATAGTKGARPKQDPPGRRSPQHPCPPEFFKTYLKI